MAPADRRGGQENEELTEERTKIPEESGLSLSPPLAAQGAQANDAPLGNVGLPPLSADGLASTRLLLPRGGRRSKPGAPDCTKLPAPLSCFATLSKHLPQALPQHLTCREPSLGSGPRGSAGVQISAATAGSANGRSPSKRMTSQNSQLQPPQTFKAGTGRESLM